jgi:hypothetical protein
MHHGLLGLDKIKSPVAHRRPTSRFIPPQLPPLGRQKQSEVIRIPVRTRFHGFYGWQQSFSLAG